MNTQTRRSLGLLGATAMAAALAPAIASAQAKPVPANTGNNTGSNAKNKVVFQVSDADPGKWSLALNNMRNLQVDVGQEDVEIELVAYGPGIGMLKADSPVATRIAEALKTGIRVVACENTMRSMKLTRADILPEVGYVPAGVVEVMRRQQDGYAYIRP